MSKITKKIIWMMTCLMVIGLGIYQYMNPVSNEVMASIFKGDKITHFAFIFISIYLFYFVYKEMLKEHHKLSTIIQSGLMFLLAVMMLMRLVIPVLESLLIYSVSIRMLAIVLLIIITENYIDKDRDLKHYLIIFVAVILILITIWFLKPIKLAMMVNVIYAIGILYIATLFYKNKFKKNESLKSFIYTLVIFSLVYDLFLLTFGVVTAEMSFTVTAIGILVIHISQLINKYNQYNEVMNENSEIIKENQKLKKEYKRSQESVDLIKTELSYKFIKKQHHFENLEIAIEVLEGSILIIDDEFKVAFAHGSLLDNSNYEDVVGMDVSKAIFDLASDEGQYFKSVLEKIFKAADDVRQQLYISLLDSQLNINNRLYDMHYNVLEKRGGNKVLVLHADMINEQTQHSAMLAREKEISQMVITVAKQGELFFSDLSTYMYFSKNLEKYLNKSDLIHDKIYRYLKRLHTFKGVFDQYNMQSTVKGLNDVENELLNMLHHSEEVTDESLIQTLISYDLEGVLQVDLDIIKEKLGEIYLENKKKITIDIVKYSRLIALLKDNPGIDQDIISSFEQLAYVDIKEVLIGYKAYIMRIANEQGKKIVFKVSGDSVMVNREKYIHFFENLIHLFKNSVIHGVEYPDERVAAHKSESANIRCHIENFDTTMVLKISDDGGGVDIREIKNKLFISGKYTMEALENLSDEFVGNLILDDGVGIGEHFSDYAGKGVGMSCIKEVLESLGGIAEVHSKAGIGVTYELRLPIQKEDDVTIFDVMAIQNTFTLEAEKILTKNSEKAEISNNWLIYKDVCKTDIMLEVTVHLVIQGVKDTHVCVSADEKMLKHLVNHYGLYGKYKGLSIKIMNEALVLFAEAITKKTVKVLKGQRQSIKTTTPSIVTNLSYESLFSGREAAISKMEIDQGKLTLMVLSAKVRKGE